MHRVRVTALAITSLLTATCGGGGAASITPVTAPSPASPQPPAVAVGPPDQPVGWSGQASTSELGTAPLRITPTQNGSQVSGDMQQFFGHAGPFAGTVSGNTLTFAFSVGMGGAGCGNAITGTASVGLVTMTGTFSGHECSGGPITNGTFTATLEGASSSPGIIPGQVTSAPYTVAGTWIHGAPDSLGGGTWTWVFSDEQGDVFQRTFSGTVTVSADSKLHIGSTTFTGTRTEMFPFLPTTGRVRWSATFGGACPTTVQWVTTFDPNSNGNRLTGNVTGMTCNGNVAYGTGISRQ